MFSAQGHVRYQPKGQRQPPPPTWNPAINWRHWSHPEEQGNVGVSVLMGSYVLSLPLFKIPSTWEYLVLLLFFILYSLVPPYCLHQGWTASRGKPPPLPTLRFTTRPRHFLPFPLLELEGQLCPMFGLTDTGILDASGGAAAEKSQCAGTLSLRAVPMLGPSRSTQ